MIHETYLPISVEMFKENHFADIRKGGVDIKTGEAHLRYYLRSIEKYEKYLKENPIRAGKPVREMKVPCQVEKDERFWIVACLLEVFYSNERVDILSKLFKEEFGDTPPLEGIKTWEDCFQGKVNDDFFLFFEPNLPSPETYKKWLVNNLGERQFIKYILDSAFEKPNLEGPTNVDAMIINANNGFATLIEAKVLSDISYSVTYDATRNQIARNIDIMLEDHRDSNLCFPLNKRDPAKTLFVLISPQLFRNLGKTRLYSYKMRDYKRDSESLRVDLIHRDPDGNRYDWPAIAQRVGWITWEDFKQINMNCCRWLKNN